MACASSGCQTGCCEDEEVKEPIVTLPANNQNHPNICIKCKSNNVAAACEGGQFCSDCFRNSLYGKFKLAVTSHAMISPSDNILVAFSGGPSSRSLSILFLIYIYTHTHIRVRKQEAEEPVLNVELRNTECQSGFWVSLLLNYLGFQQMQPTFNFTSEECSPPEKDI